MAAATTTGTLSGAMQTYYDNRFLEHYTDQLAVIPHGQSKQVPHNAGKTIDFFRYHPYALITSSEGVAAEGAVGTAVATTGINTTCMLETWKNHTNLSELLRLTSRDPNLENVIDLLAENAAASLDWRVQTEIIQYGCTMVRSDLNSSYQFEFTCGGSAANATTTTVGSTALAAAKTTNDAYIGATVTFRQGLGYGQSRVVSDFATSGGVLTWETALDEEPTSNEVQGDTDQVTGWICLYRDMIGAHASTDICNRDGFNAKSVHFATMMLEKAGAQRFSDGMYHGVIDPVCKRQLMADSEVLLYMQSSRAGKLESGAIGEYGGVAWYLTTQPMRLEETHAGDAVADIIDRTGGKMYVTWVFGKNAFGVVDLAGRRKKIYVKTPGPNSVSTPLDEYSTAGWKSFFTVKALNANNAVGIVSWQSGG
jgi:hypothetical protein